MFTGIVEELGEIVGVTPTADDSALVAVRGPLVTSDARHGDSIAVNGVCLTVVEAADGTSMWITSEAARIDVHALRGTVDAVVAGVGTVLADDPRLTARNLRDGSLAIRQPLRVVVDSSGRTPSDAQVRDGAARTWIATAAEVGAGPDGRVDLPALLAELHRRGVRAVLLEGGPRLAGAFLAAGLVDKIVGYVAPRLLGAGPTALVDAGVTTIAEAIDLEFVDVTQIGPDLRITALPRKREG